MFDPVELSVATGTEVVWDVVGPAPHTVTFLSAVANGTLPDSGDLAPGETFRVTFPTAGTFAYWCRYHSDGRTGMVGSVVVG